MSNSTLAFTSTHRTRRLIMIVAHDDECHRVLSAALDGEYDVLGTHTGEEALKLAYVRKDELGLVLLKLQLPDRAGALEVLKQFNDDPVLMRIPVIAVDSDRSGEVDALNSGAMDFMTVPCQIPEALKARVLHAIELSENLNLIRSTERDALTGLYNKDFFFNYAEQYDTYHRNLDMDAMVVNISHFHMINERYGKIYGDEILKSVGRRLSEYVTDDDGIVCRRESDTFLLYCPHREDYEDILRYSASGTDHQIRLRMGVYPNVDKSLDIDQRFDRAKLASDTVRNNFNKTVALYDDRLHKSEVYTEQLLDDFPRALEEKQFVVYYQPKFGIQTTMPLLNSAEALVRWRHPTMGMIPPGDFIPLFESNGLIQQLDNYVWREVARQMREWKDLFNFCVPVSVNVSRVDIFDFDLANHMKALVEEFGIEPGEFLLEITESAYTQDSKQIIETVKQLREAGFRIEVDDFGSGYSSLNMIASLPMDALKLDMQFMHNAFKERKNTKMLDAVIDIAYSLDVPTIAEGVENAEQMFALKEMGCNIVQGFYFSKPIPARDYERFLLERKRSVVDSQQERDREARIKPADQFAYEALHDPLTGLYNHSAYKMLLKDADQRNIALIVAQLMDFNHIAETFGAHTADRIVLLVAKTLHGSFRSVDFICRISKDEFAIIMTRVNSELRPLISSKAERINGIIQDHCADLPPFRLKVGVAFADRDNPHGDIFQDADLALDRARNSDTEDWVIY